MCVCGWVDGWVHRVPHPVWWWSSPTRIRSAPSAVCSRWLVRWASSTPWPCSLEPTEPTLRQDAPHNVFFFIHSYLFNEPQILNGVPRPSSHIEKKIRYFEYVSRETKIIWEPLNYLISIFLFKNILYYIIIILYYILYLGQYPTLLIITSPPPCRCSSRQRWWHL